MDNLLAFNVYEVVLRSGDREYLAVETDGSIDIEKLANKEYGDKWYYFKIIDDIPMYFNHIFHIKLTYFDFESAKDFTADEGECD